MGMMSHHPPMEAMSGLPPMLAEAMTHLQSQTGEPELSLCQFVLRPHTSEASQVCHDACQHLCVLCRVEGLLL